jgi:hypothetical protein
MGENVFTFLSRQQERVVIPVLDLILESRPKGVKFPKKYRYHPAGDRRSIQTHSGSRWRGGVGNTVHAQV